MTQPTDQVTDWSSPTEADQYRPDTTVTPSLIVREMLDPDTVLRYTRVPDTDGDLDIALREQAGRLYYISARAAAAHQQLHNVKIGMDVLRATLYNKHRQLLRAELAGAEKGAPKVTEGQITAALERDPAFIKASMMLGQAEMYADLAKAAVEAMRHQRDTILVRAHDRRAERAGEMRVGSAPGAPGQSAQNAAVDVARQQMLANLAMRAGVSASPD